MERRADGEFAHDYAGFWVPPVKFFDGYSYSIYNRKLGEGSGYRFVLNPWSSQHSYDFRLLTVKETVITPTGSRSLISVLTVKNRGKKKAKVPIRLDVDIDMKQMNLKWPLREIKHNPIWNRRAIHVKASGKPWHLVYGLGISDAELLSASPKGIGIEIELRPGETAEIPFIFSASLHSKRDALESYDSAYSGWKGIVKRERAASVRAISRDVLETPDELVNTAHSWSKLHKHGIKTHKRKSARGKRDSHTHEIDDIIHTIEHSKSRKERLDAICKLRRELMTSWGVRTKSKGKGYHAAHPKNGAVSMRHTAFLAKAMVKHGLSDDAVKMLSAIGKDVSRGHIGVALRT